MSLKLYAKQSLNAAKANPPTTISDWLKQATKKLDAAGIASARLDAIILLEHATKLNRSQILAYEELPLTATQLAIANQHLSDRLAHIPIAYIVRHKEFWGMDLTVDSRALIPRVETEAMVEYALLRLPSNARVLDLGTGSGAVAIAIKQSRPDTSVVASDISKDALSLARTNAAKFNLEINFILSDLFQSVKGRFHLIAANLPYLPTTDKTLMPDLNYEPKQALYGGADGLALYKRFVTELHHYLTPSGSAIIELMPSQYQTMLNWVKNYHFSLTRYTDYVYRLHLL